MSKALPAAIAFSLSDDSSIEAVLTDIPFLCVGLVAFGVLTFVLFMKRIDLIAIYLYISSFIAFVAAILDLSQTLAQGKINALGPPTASGLTIAREVALALSVGFLYIFLWCLVAQCPRGEQPASFMDVNGKRYYTDYAHSASWKRWGVLGLLLKWSLLGLSFSIPVLQIVWRVSASDPQFGTTYISEATIEVVVSALFILKLFLNIFLSPLTPWWLPIQLNIAPTIALLISGGLGIGNLASLAFSESTLGRFLRAVEIYILILFVLIIAFYSPPSSRTSPDSFIAKELRSDTTGEKPSGSALAMNPRVPQRLVTIDHPTTIDEGKAVVHSRSSTRSGLSSWVLPRRSRRPEIKDHLFTRDGELGIASDHTNIPQSDSEHSNRLGVNEDAGFTTIPSTSDAPKSTEDQSSINERPFTAGSISSYYAMAENSNTSFTMSAQTFARGTDSPIYGLDGIIQQNRAMDALQPHRNSSTGSFDELLRQQTELDKSIAALRLFSSSGASALVTPAEAQVTVSDTLSAESEVSTSKDRSTSVSTLSYLGRKPDSASNRSEFSLSYFPEPPVVNTNPLAPTNERSRFPRKPRVDVATSSLPPIEVPEQETVSLPVSPSQFEQNGRSDSAGTQYDVTSFIGGLTVPTSGAAFPSSNLTNKTILSDVESEDEVTPTTSLPNASVDIIEARQRTLRSSIPFERSPESLELTISISSVTTRSPETVQKLRREPSIVLRPLLLGTPSAVAPLNLTSNTKVPIVGHRRKNGGLPSNPRRPMISGPSVSLQDGMGDDVPGAFEKPRPPPPRFVPEKPTV